MRAASGCSIANEPPVHAADPQSQRMPNISLMPGETHLTLDDIAAAWLAAEARARRATTKSKAASCLLVFVAHWQLRASS